MQGQKVAGSIPASVTFPNQPKVRFINASNSTIIVQLFLAHQTFDANSAHPQLGMVVKKTFFAGNLPSEASNFWVTLYMVQSATRIYGVDLAIA